MVHGITGKVMIGIPPAVKQEEVGGGRSLRYCEGCFVERK